MKIPLHLSQNGTQSSRAAQARTLARDIAAAKKGDWNANNSICRTFQPLLTSLAQKRSQDTAEINRLVESGKQGLLKAVKKFNLAEGGDHFQIFALDFIESAMDKKDKGGFLSRLFGK